MKWWTYGRTDGRSRDNPNFSRLQVIISLSHGAPLRASRAREVRYYTIKKKKHDAFGSALKPYLYWGFSMKYILTNTFQAIISGNQEHNCIHKSRRCSHSFEMRGIRDSLQHIHRHLHNTNHIVRIRQTLPANSLTTQKTSINSFYNLLEG